MRIPLFGASVLPRVTAGEEDGSGDAVPLLAVLVDLDFRPGAPEGVLGGAGEEAGFRSRRGGNAGGVQSPSPQSSKILLTGTR